jgi:hypothetical protein
VIVVIFDTRLVIFVITISVPTAPNGKANDYLGQKIIVSGVYSSRYE